MQFPPNKLFERDPYYIDIALATRGKKWWKSSEPVASLPSPLEIAHL
jgi:hypothetical protein